MTTIREAADAFLATRRIAVTGVSRKGDHGSNVVYERLRDRGYEVFAVNPNAEKVMGDRSYHSLSEIDGGVDAVVIGTSPAHAQATMEECAALGITQTWMHRSFGSGSVDAGATEWGRRHGITVIDGGCPLMYGPTSDVGHKIMKLFCSRHIPREV